MESITTLKSYWKQPEDFYPEGEEKSLLRLWFFHWGVISQSIFHHSSWLSYLRCTFVFFFSLYSLTTSEGGIRDFAPLRDSFFPHLFPTHRFGGEMVLRELKKKKKICFDIVENNKIHFKSIY